jgi:flavodoxin
MKEIAVVYKSKYGSTRKYAEWIAEELGADLMEAPQANAQIAVEYRTIVYGGGLYASGINGVSLITKNFPQLQEKNLIVFTVGLADPEAREQFVPILEKNFTEEMRGKIKIFHLRGGMDYKNLGMVHKAMMSMVKNMVAKKEEAERTDEDRQMLETYGQVVDLQKERPSRR